MQEDVINLLNYDCATGVFTWKPRRGVKAGVPLGTDNGHGYKRITVLGKSYYAHRLAWLYMHGEIPDCQIDHIDGNKANNSISNLRKATPSQNQHNHCIAQSNSKSGIQGVSWHKKARKWQSHIKINGEKKYLGLFYSKYDAKNAYEEIKKELRA